MPALVTGGTGFIGSHLVDELLEHGYDVQVLRRTTSTTRFLEQKKIRCSIGDLTDKESLHRACRHVDVVFHVAALPRDWGSKEAFFEINISGTKNLLDACVTNKVPRFVFMSSAAVYGFPRAGLPIREDSPKRPTTKYGTSKLCAENLLWEYATKEGMSVSAVRSPLVIGPRDMLIAPFLMNALQQDRIFFINCGEQKISISDGRDVAQCLRLAGETNKAHTQAYNVKSFDSTPKQLIESLAEQIHVPLPTKNRSYLSAYLLAVLLEGLWMVHRTGDPPLTRHRVRVLGHTRLLDITKAERDLKYKPRYDLPSTINDLVEWYQKKEVII